MSNLTIENIVTIDNIEFIASLMFLLGCVFFSISILAEKNINIGFLIGIICFTIGSVLYMVNSYKYK